jgi:hypothetical protein
MARAEQMRRDRARQAQLAAAAATIRSTETPSAADDVAFVSLSCRGAVLADATVDGPAVTLRGGLAVSYLPLAAVEALRPGWTRRHAAELRERSLLVVFGALEGDLMAAIMKAIKSPLQDAGGRERREFEMSADHVVAQQHLDELLKATRDRAQLERWLGAAGDAPHAGGIRARLRDLFGDPGFIRGIDFTTPAHSVGLKGI